MRGNAFLDKMSLVNPAFVETAEAVSKKRKNIRFKWYAAAACFALLIYAGTRLFTKDSKGNSTDLPLLYISENTSAMGYEGYMAYDASELVSANPWREDMELATMPVYQNTLDYDDNFIASGVDFEKMQKFLLEVAGRLGLDANELTITDDVPDEESRKKIIEKFNEAGDTVPEGYFNPTRLIIEAEGLKIEVDRTMTAKVTFKPAVKLPDKYNFIYFASYEDIAAVAEYLKTEYKNFIGYENTLVNIHGGDYNIYAQQMYSIEFFGASGNDTELIINYNFNRTAFYCDGEGNLAMARIYQPDLSKKVGDYPIISLAQAEELLSKGKYITTVPYEMPGSEYVKKVELIYRTGELEEYYMPYYRFYVELPQEERENGLKTYGAYYVPAVESTYISNMPTWDGSFN